MSNFSKLKYGKIGNVCLRFAPAQRVLKEGMSKKMFRSTVNGIVMRNSTITYKIIGPIIHQNLFLVDSRLLIFQAIRYLRNDKMAIL